MVGLLASASQLAHYGTRIALQLHETYRNVRKDPKRIRERLEQVKALIQATTLIENNTYLRVPSVKTPLLNALSEAQFLHNLLHELNYKYTKNTIPRYWAAISGAGQDQVSISLERLEGAKTTLSLCIATIQTDLLGDIRSNLTPPTPVKMPHERFPVQPTYSVRSDRA